MPSGLQHLLVRFPQVPDVQHPDFFKKMDHLVELNSQVSHTTEHSLENDAC